MKVQIVTPKLGFILLMGVLSLFFDCCKEDKSSRKQPLFKTFTKPNNPANGQNLNPGLNTSAANPAGTQQKPGTFRSDLVKKQHNSGSDYSKTDGGGGGHSGGGNSGQKVKNNVSHENSNDNIDIQGKLPDNIKKN